MSIPDPAAGSRPTADECNLAALAHVSILLSLLIPGLGIIAALVVYATQKDRSSYVTRQALQATVFQLLLAIGPIILLLIGLITFVPIIVVASIMSDALGAMFGVTAILCLLLLGILELVGFIWALVGAYQTYHGRRFRYPLVGGMMDRT
jgi:uncharacterized Tic20 family protein